LMDRDRVLKEILSLLMGNDGYLEHV
jgi:hypothetical protein